MKALLLSRSGLLFLRWSVLFFLLALIGAIYISMRVDATDDRSSMLLRASQQRLNNARQQVERIEDEESTIVEFIDRYMALEEAGILDEENRLAFKETFARIRDRNNLFPIQLNVEKQQTMRLPYPADITDNGGPVNLKYSNVKFNMYLLHEQDMIRLLTELMTTPGLFHVRECSIQSNYRDGLNYYYLAQHFTGNCELFWYTFDTDPETEAQL